MLPAGCFFNKSWKGRRYTLERNLNQNWNMTFEPYGTFTTSLPASVYTVLLREGKIPDPFYGLNEFPVRELSRNDSVFFTSFSLTAEELKKEHLILRFDCIDTIATVFVNGVRVGRADNMFAAWDFEIGFAAREGTNTLRVEIDSPIRCAEQAQDADHLWGQEEWMTMRGYQHLRKAHCMFGWDWGPQLPDMGIYRGVKLLAYDGARLESFLVLQDHRKDGSVELTVTAEFSDGAPHNGVVSVKNPDGGRMDVPLKGGKASFPIEAPRLWWPHGYGGQPLYTVTVCAGEQGEQSKRIGLRTLTVSTAQDRWGSEFAFVVNGVKIFAMGADYIPEDNLIPRVTPERTAALIRSCVEANYNCLRVWGGGYYPDDTLFDLCDENGLIVWQDFMFACAVYRLTDAFRESVTREFIHNIKRLRHHPSLGLFCGNNEMEAAWVDWGLPKNETLRMDYLELYERLLPRLVRQYAPQTFYWPASPSTNGGFDNPNSPDGGDVHYWDVWHGSKPFEDYRNYYFRFCSEFGFEAFPDCETLRGIGEEKDMNPFSRVMESHQKCAGGNQKILNYHAGEYRYPSSFENFVYASQLLQRDAIKYGVEHFRRFRGRCMGAVYWQLNDIWPGPSWASVDYYGRWKALHYAAKRFFAPVLLSIHLGDGKAVLNVSNETRNAFRGTVRAGIRTAANQEVLSLEQSCTVDALSSLDVLVQPVDTLTEEQRYSCYFYCELLDENGSLLSRDTALFVKPKHFEFLDPCLTAEVLSEEGALSVRVSASAYARGVRLSAGDLPVRFTNNYFDLTGGSVTVGVIGTSGEVISSQMLEKSLSVCSVYEIG